MSSRFPPRDARHDERAAARLIRRSDQACEAGRFADAELHARAALARLDGRHGSIAVRCAAERSLGTALRARARYREAERYLRRALKRASSAGPLEQAASNNALGMLFKYTGRHAEAARLYREALDLLEAQLGAHDLRLAPVLHNLGGLEHARGRYAAGEAHARRGLAIRRRVLGRDHIVVASDEVALGALLEGQSKRGEAGRLYRHALSVFERVRGQRYEIAVTCNNLGTLSYARGRLVEARALYLRSLRIKLRLLGERHPDVAVTRNNLAALTAAQGDDAAARALYAQALAVFERIYGVDHRLTRICRANLV